MTFFNGKAIVDRTIKEARKDHYQIGKNSTLYSRLEIINNDEKKCYMIYFELYDDHKNLARRVSCEFPYMKEGLKKAIEILEYASKFKIEDEDEK